MKQIRPSQAYIDQARAGALLEKWSPVLDYESKNVAPIEDEHNRLNTAILLENQEAWCLSEASNTGSTGGSFGTHEPTAGTFSGDRYASGDARLPKILIPMIRRTFPELITNEIVGVQPMSGPVGLAFALRYKYEAESLGAGPALGDASKSVGTGAAGVHDSQQGGYQSDDTELGYQRLDTRFTGTSSLNLSGSSDFELVDADMGVANLLANYELTSQIPQVVVSFEKTAVEAGTRRLAARWSVELEQDLKNMNGIDIDTELTNAMSYELQAEIDREMIMRMIQTALTAGTTKGYSFWSAASADGRWMAERNRDFYQKLIVGNLGGRFNVYRDTRTEGQFEDGQRSVRLEYALLGYKGPEFYDTGIIYCPYIPVMVQRTIGPNDFAPRVGMLTRYGVVDHIFGANLYYHVVIVQDLGKAFTPGNQSVYL
jgi:hypothetical protein